ncbi:MAG: pyridoxal kinase [Thalassobaculaceae bacterium]
MTILSISSRVVYGYVGNSAMVPALQQLGLTVWPVDTVVFSNHPGHGEFQGVVRDPSDLAALLRGLADLGVLATCRAVISGYLGNAENAAVVESALDLVRAANPGALYCCDPVIGDNGRNYVGADVVTAIRERLLPRADLATPNRHELAVLTGAAATAGVDETPVTAARRLPLAGPRLALVTGDRRGDEVWTWLIDAERAESRRQPWRDRPISGAGDLLAALFLGYWLRLGAPWPALPAAVTRVSEMIDASGGTRDIDVVAGLNANG